MVNAPISEGEGSIAVSSPVKAVGAYEENVREDNVDGHKSVLRRKGYTVYEMRFGYVRED